MLNELSLPKWKLLPAQYRLVAKDVVPQNLETVLKRKETSLAGAAWKTINEVREEEGLAKVRDVDELFIPFTLTTIDLTANRSPESSWAS